MKELKENDEVLINDIDEKEFLYTGKEKKIKRAIIFSLMLLVIAAIIIIIVVASKKSGNNKSDDSSDEISDVTSDDVSDDTSDDISDYTSDDISDQSSDDISDDTSDDISDDTSDDISDHTSDDISDDTSDDISDHTSDDDEYITLLNNSNFEKPNNFLKQYEFIQLRDSEYKFFLVHDPKTMTAGIEFRTKFGYTTDIIDGFANYAENVFFEGTE